MGPAAIGLTTASQVAGDLNRGDKQSAAESGLSGLAAMFPRIFGPLGSAVYSRGLNEGEDEELARRRRLAPTIFKGSQSTGLGNTNPAVSGKTSDTQIKPIVKAIADNLPDRLFHINDEKTIRQRFLDAMN
jgi:hypothetical protein